MSVFHIIWRKAFIDGPVLDDDFFENRKRLIAENYDSEKFMSFFVN